MIPSSNTPKVKLSVIVPCYRQALELQGCLEVLMKQETAEPFEIIVVDSGNDPDVRNVAGGFPGVQCITGEDRLYCGAAKHFGAGYAAGEYFAFTDSDCRPEEQWVDRAIELLDQGIDFAGGPILDALPWHLVSISDNALQFSDFQIGRPAGPIKHIPGANMIISKEAYFSAGGLPPMNSGDDVTITMNYNELHRGPIFYSPQLRIKHIGRRSFRNFFSHQYNFGKEANIWIYDSQGNSVHVLRDSVYAVHPKSHNGGRWDHFFFGGNNANSWTWGPTMSSHYYVDDLIIDNGSKGRIGPRYFSRIGARTEIAPPSPPVNLRGNQVNAL